MHKKCAGGGLDPKWLGPYEVIKDIGKGLFLVQKCIGDAFLV